LYQCFAKRNEKKVYKDDFYNSFCKLFSRSFLQSTDTTKKKEKKIPTEIEKKRKK
jgi:hypothetical protein